LPSAPRAEAINGLLFDPVEMEDPSGDPPTVAPPPVLIDVAEVPDGVDTGQVGRITACGAIGINRSRT